MPRSRRGEQRHVATDCAAARAERFSATATKREKINVTLNPPRFETRGKNGPCNTLSRIARMRKTLAFQELKQLDRGRFPDLSHSCDYSESAVRGKAH